MPSPILSGLHHGVEPLDPSSVVVCGYAFRLPGADSPSELSDVLLEGRVTYSSFPAHRIDPQVYRGAQGPWSGASVSNLQGGFIGGRGAAHGASGGGGDDDTHAWLLDTLDRALDSARLARASLRGRRVPVFLAHSRGGGKALYDAALAASVTDLLPCLVAGAHPGQYSPGDLRSITAALRRTLDESLQAGPAGARAVHHLPALLAQALGTSDKAVLVDGNCTGGLVALDMAVREVRSGAPYAVAGALSYVDALNQVIYSNAQLLAAGACLPFLDGGTGTVISDGVTLVIVTTCAQARSLDLPVRGVIRGIGGANDGAAERYMLTPHPRGHALAIARAHERAQVPPGDVDFYLAHGSGTRLGDRIEAQVFEDFLAARGSREDAVPLLSIKGHLGHAKEAAGLANLVAALALFEAGRVFEPLAPDGPRSSFDHLRQVRVGPRPRGRVARAPRRAGVSAIASGGQNYHVLVDAPPRTAPPGAQPETAHARFEPIAIVGMAASFAEAPDVARYWSRLMAGHASFAPQPLARPWTLLDDDTGAAAAWAGECPGVYTRRSARLDLDPTRWARRAERYAERPTDMLRHDPLHYLLVDLAREAARGRDIAPGSNIAVVLGAEHCSEFALRQVVAARLPEIERHLGDVMRAAGGDGHEIQRTMRAALRVFRAELPDLSPGSLFNISPSFMAARIARAFDLSGPVCAVEAGGGSSSFAALDAACRKLADREVDAVFCASAERRCGPVRLAEECALGLLSRRDSPSAFCDGSDGYLPGEGATVLLLRRLADARRTGEPVLGIIQGIGSGFAPRSGPRELVSRPAMTSAIDRALQAAGVAADALAFVEGFGSGVPCSDTAEAEAMCEALVARSRPLPIGSVMPNIGHCGAAAGAASLIKALLALRHGVLPATRGASTPSFRGLDPLRVATTPLALQGARLAGINAASPGGTHFHVVVEAGGPPS